MNVGNFEKKAVVPLISRLFAVQSQSQAAKATASQQSFLPLISGNTTQFKTCRSFSLFYFYRPSDVQPRGLLTKVKFRFLMQKYVMKINILRNKKHCLLCCKRHHDFFVYGFLQILFFNNPPPLIYLFTAENQPFGYAYQTNRRISVTKVGKKRGDDNDTNATYLCVRNFIVH